MANPSVAKSKPSEPTAEAAPMTLMTVAIPAIAWLIPGQPGT